MGLVNKDKRIIMMKEWNNKCPKCENEILEYDNADVYYDRNPYKVYCKNCGTTIVIKLIPVLSRFYETDDK